jgi:hypothetical protein
VRRFLKEDGFVQILWREVPSSLQMSVENVCSSLEVIRKDCLWKWQRTVPSSFDVKGEEDALV